MFCISSQLVTFHLSPKTQLLILSFHSSMLRCTSSSLPSLSTVFLVDFAWCVSISLENVCFSSPECLCRWEQKYLAQAVFGSQTFLVLWSAIATFPQRRQSLSCHECQKQHVVHFVKGVNRSLLCLYIFFLMLVRAAASQS